MSRSGALLCAGALAMCLIAGSPHDVVGDGGEYIAQAINFSSFHGPALAANNLSAIQGRVARNYPRLADWEIEKSTVRGSTGGRDFVHFWFYALLATPALWIATAVGTPTAAFAALNLVFFGLALWVALPRIGSAAAILLFASPIVWWLDKAHTEVFTFALLTIAIALVRDRPWWSMIAAGAAATQNPPIAILVALVFAGAIVDRRAVLGDRRFLAGAALGVGLALLHPVYTYARHGTPSLLLLATRPGVPTFAEVSAVVADPSIGLISNFPFWLLVVAVALVMMTWRDRRAWLSVDIVIAVVAGAAFLFSFARTTNFHHGATPSLSRYALWLIPLAVPVLRWTAVHGRGLWRAFLWTTAVVSASVSVFAFHPQAKENSREPTWLAAWLWSRHPGWNNPIPEIFIETELHVDQRWSPVATPGCEKVLVAGRGTKEGVWPMPCYPVTVPERCGRVGAVCYANLAGHDYNFIGAPGRWDGVGPLRKEAVWPTGTEATVRKFFDEWKWWNLPVRSQGLDVLRQPIEVNYWAMGGADNFVLTLKDFGPGPKLQFRLPGPMTGVLVAADTGQTVSDVHYDGAPYDLWTLELPRTFNVLLLAMHTEPAR